MKLKPILLVAFLFLGAMIVSLKITSVTDPQTSDTIYSRKWATLAERAQEAKEKGKKRVVFPAQIGNPAHVESLSQAFDLFQVLVVKPVAQYSAALGKDGIVTWHKFKVIEDLSQDNTPYTSHMNLMEILPGEIDYYKLEEDEVLVPQYCGILNVDGITLIQETDEFPLLSKRQKYLLFLSKNPYEKFGRMVLGPSSVYAVNPDNSLRPLVERQHAIQHHPIYRDLKQNYARSLNRLKENMSKRQ